MVNIDVMYNADYFERELNNEYYADAAQNKNINKKMEELLTPSAMGLIASELGYDKKKHTLEEHKLNGAGFLRDADNKLIAMRRNTVTVDSEGNPVVAKKDEKNERIAYQMLFTYDKSIDVWFSQATQEQQIAFLEHRNKTFRSVIVPEMERDAMYRTGKGGKELHQGLGLHVNVFNHLSNRNDNCFIHPHVVIWNTTKTENGQLNSLDNEVIFNNAQKYDALLLAHDAKFFQDIQGLELEQVWRKSDNKKEIKEEDKNANCFRIKNIDKNICKAYSTRKKEVDDEVEEMKRMGKIPANAKNVFDAGEIAQKTTREAKSNLDAEQLLNKFSEEVDALGFSKSQCQALKTDKQKHIDLSDSKDPKQIPTDAMILDSVYRVMGESVFTEEKFKAHILKQLAIKMPIDKALEKAENLFQDSCVALLDKELVEQYTKMRDERLTVKNDGSLSLNPDGTTYLKSDGTLDFASQEQISMKLKKDLRYATKEFIANEQFVIKHFKARENEEYNKLPFGYVTKKIAEFNSKQEHPFTEDQVNVILGFTTQRGGHHLVNGVAGGGKSFAMDAVRKIYQDAAKDLGIPKKKIIGLAPSGASSEELASSTGLGPKDCMNTAEFLIAYQNGKVKIDENTIILADEFGMTDSKTYYEIAKILEKHTTEKGGPKLLLVGEDKQLSSVGAGGLFITMKNKFEDKTVQMNQIFRQVTDTDKQFVELMRQGKAQEGMDYLFEKGRVVITKTEEERMQECVKRFCANHNVSKFIVAPNNEHCESLNELIREQYKSEGKLGEAKMIKLQDIDETVKEFSINERIVINKNFSALEENGYKSKLKNGQAGTIKGFSYNNKNELIIAVLMDKNIKSGKLSYINENDTHFQYGNAITVHKSQGATKDDVEYFTGEINSRNMAYVAMSRFKKSLTVYLSQELIENQVKKMNSHLKPTDGMMELLSQLQDEGKIPQDFEGADSFEQVRYALNKHSGRKLQEYEPLKATAKETYQFQNEQLEDFNQLIGGMCKAQFKKTTFDYVKLHKDAQLKMEEIKSHHATIKSDAPKIQAITSVEQSKLEEVLKEELKITTKSSNEVDKSKQIDIVNNSHPPKNDEKTIKKKQSPKVSM